VANMRYLPRFGGCSVKSTTGDEFTGRLVEGSDEPGIFRNV
jgi:hypothetical protein